LVARLALSASRWTADVSHSDDDGGNQDNDGDRRRCFLFWRAVKAI